MPSNSSQNAPLNWKTWKFWSENSPFLASNKTKMTRGKWRKWDENSWEIVKSVEMRRNRDEPKMSRKWRNRPKIEKPARSRTSLISENAYSCMRLRSEWLTESENLKARFDWRNCMSPNFDAFWRFFGPYYKDFWEIRKMTKMAENGRNRLKWPKTSKSAKTAEIG